MTNKFEIFKTGFFGWNNIKWGIKELIKMYSNHSSFFSYKRFQTGFAFFWFIQGAIYVLYNYVKTVEQFAIWCVPVLLVCGYTLNQTQKEKTELLNREEV
jgi:hypothetical protein